MKYARELFVIVALLLGISLTACERIAQTQVVSPQGSTAVPTTACSQTASAPLVKCSPLADPGAVLNGGVGILGDSFYDEYQADDNRGGPYSGVTFNLIEILVHNRGFDLGPWGVWGEPRRTGYAYNWARSGATSSDLILQGQHIGLAEQVSQGKVKYVFIGIGANDFNPYYGPAYPAIYNGQMSDEDLTKKIQTAVENVTLAVETVQQAGAKQIVVTHFTQFDMDPILDQIYPDRVRRKRVAQAVEQVNQGIDAMGAKKGVVVLDQNALGAKILPNLQDNRYLNVDGELIDFLTCDDDPRYSRLADKQHIGTVMSGVTANWYFIDTFNTHFGTQIAPLSNAEILKIAGIR